VGEVRLSGLRFPRTGGPFPGNLSSGGQSGGAREAAEQQIGERRPRGSIWWGWEEGAGTRYQVSIEAGDHARMESRRRMTLDELRVLQSRASSARSEDMAVAVADAVGVTDGTSEWRRGWRGGGDLRFGGLGLSLLCCCCYSVGGSSGGGGERGPTWEEGLQEEGDGVRVGMDAALYAKETR
jgi:hypothetical protein